MHPRQRPARSSLGGRYREMLACIRCGACLNVCPVYRKTGGAAYGPVYSGPMGAVLVPLLAGLEQAPDLPHASSLCGACTDACPVKIPLHELLLELRRDLVEQGVAPFHERLSFRLWSYAWSSPAGYRLTTRLARLGGPFAGLVGPGAGVAKGPEAAEARAALQGPPVSLADQFAANAETAGFVVHRGERSCRSTAPACPAPCTRSPTRAASCSRPRRTNRVPPRCCRTSTSRSCPRTSSSPGLEELFAAVGDDLPSSLAIVTGPSRSADIEQLLTVGVHGPGEVHVVIQGR